MIDSFLAFLGVSPEYEIFAIILCGAVITFISLQLLNVVSSLLKWVGGY